MGRGHAAGLDGAPGSILLGTHLGLLVILTALGTCANAHIVRNPIHDGWNCQRDNSIGLIVSGMMQVVIAASW
jgi:hypothetical protein